jgi:hypothetical protein
MEQTRTEQEAFEGAGRCTANIRKSMAVQLLGVALALALVIAAWVLL